MKFSSSPWRASKSGWPGRDPRHPLVRWTIRNEHQMDLLDCQPSWEAEANARLMTMAPDMFIALELAARWIAQEMECMSPTGNCSEYWHETKEMYNKIEEILNKAYGDRQ